jgi:hypothetical protein
MATISQICKGNASPINQPSCSLLRSWVKQAVKFCSMLERIQDLKMKKNRKKERKKGKRKTQQDWIFKNQIKLK